MNINEYIRSGIIESYVLGLATEAEQKEFESLCSKHPEILDLRQSFEKALEDELTRNAISPSSNLKGKILNSLVFKQSNGIPPTPRELIPNNTVALVPGISVWKWLAVATLILLAGSLYWNYAVTTEFQKFKKEDLAKRDHVNPFDYPENYHEFKDIVERPSVKWSTMVEPTNSGHCMAHVYWDSLSKGTYLLIGNIPPPKSNQQFQLWAMLDNAPTNLGVFDIKKEGQLVHMKNLPEAKVFIITIEPKGGSAVPTMNSMYAIGKL